MLPNVEDLAGAVLTIASLARGLERVLPDMTLAQYRILTMIGTSPQRAGRLAERATLSKSALTGLLDGLTARGWVRRIEIEGDRRGVGLELTDDRRRGPTAGRASARRPAASTTSASWTPPIARPRSPASPAMHHALEAAWQAEAVTRLPRLMSTDGSEEANARPVDRRPPRPRRAAGCAASGRSCRAHRGASPSPSARPWSARSSSP